LPPDLRHNLFLIVKESLTNAIKHAGATRVSVQAKMQGSLLTVEVQDDGQGFDPSAPQTDQRHGLTNMQRRAEAVGATLELRSTPGQGTLVHLRTPLPSPRAEVD
jgi:signal transduction histidine kinase